MRTALTALLVVVLCSCAGSGYRTFDLKCKNVRPIGAYTARHKAQTALVNRAERHGVEVPYTSDLWRCVGPRSEILVERNQ